MFSLVFLFLLSPVFILVAIAIKYDSPGPVFYRGFRVGRDGRTFRIYKFRSMHVNAEKTGGTTTAEGDKRVTRVGHFIRKYKLDEVSQLVNVLVGDMSVVGPRPQVRWAVDTFTEEERKVLALRPGITDWASIKFHNEGEIIEQSGIGDPDEAYMKLIHPEKMRLQLLYLKEHNFLVDMSIIFQTISTLLHNRKKTQNDSRIGG